MDKIKIDKEIEEMKKHPIDYSDIPERTEGGKARLARKDFLDTLPVDIVQEMARRRLNELQTAGYKIPEETFFMVSEKSPQKKEYGFGCLKEQIKISDDFDEPLEDFKE